jgi:hypothetical protein
MQIADWVRWTPVLITVTCALAGLGLGAAAGRWVGDAIGDEDPTRLQATGANIGAVLGVVAGVLWNHG